MDKCDIKNHLFEKGGETMICSKCSMTFEEYTIALIDYVEDYRNFKRANPNGLSK